MAIESEEKTNKFGKLEDRVFAEQAYEEKIIDLDFHLHIPYQVLLPYIEDPYVRDAIERGGAPPTSKKNVTIGYAKAKPTAESHDRVHGIAANSEEIREISDELAIDIPIVQPGTNLPLLESQYPVLSNALVKAYNDYIVDKVIDVENDIYATLMIPQWDTEFALQEIDRLGDHEGIAAAQNYMITGDLWGDPKFDPILEQLVDLDLNLILHHTSSNIFGVKTDMRSTQTYAEHMVYGYGFNCISNALNLAMSGVFDKFPELKISLQESGVLWMPWAAYRCDEEYLSYPNDVGLARRLYSRGQRDLERMPSEYVFENLYVATQPTALANIPRSDHREALIKACRAGDTWQYTSDWPHLTIDPVDWIYNERGIDDELRSKILYENSEEFLRL